MKKLLALILGTITLVGCISTGTSSFQRVSDPSHFSLESDLMVKNKVSSGLAKGLYQAVFQTPEFTYYLSEPKSLIIIDEAKNINVRVNGGVAIPNQKNMHCHIFIQIGDDYDAIMKSGGGPVVASLSRLETGRIREFKNDPDCDRILENIHVIADKT